MKLMIVNKKHVKDVGKSRETILAEGEVAEDIGDVVSKYQVLEGIFSTVGARK